MRHRNSRHPIGRCKGCGLNFRTFCGKFENPGKMWGKGKCNGFMDGDLLREYLEETSLEQAVTSKRIRKEVAKLRATEPHHQGMWRPEHRFKPLS